MRDHRPTAACLGIGMPSQILLDSQGRARRKGTINAIAPPFKVGIAVVRIHHCARTRMPLLRAQRRTTNQESQGNLRIAYSSGKFIYCGLLINSLTLRGRAPLHAGNAGRRLA